MGALRYAESMNRYYLPLLALLVFISWTTRPSFAEEESSQPPPLLLIAKPEMEDPRFQGSVVLVTFHGGSSPVGVILNRPTGVHLNDLFSDLPELDARTGMIYFGGPLAPEVLTYLVETDTHPQNALTITEQIYLALDPDLLRDFIEQPDRRTQLRVYAGYAGWAPGQLGAEIDRGDWWTLPLRRRYLFPDDPEKLWDQIVQELKGKWI